MNYSVRNVKSLSGTNDSGYTCTLYRNDSPIGKVTDQGKGVKEYSILRQDLIRMEKETGRKTDDTIDSLVNSYILIHQVKRLCKTKTVVIHNINGLDTLQVLDYPYEESKKESILSQFNKAVILNEVELS
jgi:hypothetical protein